MEIVNSVSSIVKNMENKYPVLSEIIKNEFAYVMELNRNESVDFLLDGIKEGIYNIESVKNEYDIAINDKAYDWVDFAISTKMLWDKESLSNNNVINYLKYYFEEVVYPDRKISDEKFDEILQISLKILKNQPRNNPWINIEELYKQLNERTKSKKLPYYTIYKLMINNGFNVEGRSERGKGKEIIFVKYVE